MPQSKYLVVYYSRTGTTRAVAVALAKALHCDIEAIVDNSKRAGIFGYLRCLLDTLQNRSASIAPPKKNISGYELIIVGTPVWAGSVAAPVRAYLEMQKQRLPEVAFFCAFGGRGAETTLAQMQRMAGKTPCAYLAVKAGDTRSEAFQQQIGEFVKAVATHLKSCIAKRTVQHEMTQSAPAQHERQHQEHQEHQEQREDSLPLGIVIDSHAID